MKNLLLSLALAFSFAAVAEDSRQNADALYAARDYSDAGVAKAMEAAEMYTRLSLWTDAAKSFYFVGSYQKDKQQRIAIFQKGIDAAQKIVTAYLPELKQQTLEQTAKDVLAKYNPNEVLELSHALYYNGINLGAWAEANGVNQSLSKWPTLRNYMLMIDLLGHKDINHYGASRVLGRAYYRLPVIAGGDKDKARAYLSTAFDNTKKDGISTNGNNNLFYAEFLYNSDKKKDEAIALLKAFVAANPDQLDPDSIPETKAAQEASKKLLTDWEE
jgi:hypothetical protein